MHISYICLLAVTCATNIFAKSTIYTCTFFMRTLPACVLKFCGSTCVHLVFGDMQVLVSVPDPFSHLYITRRVYLPTFYPFKTKPVIHLHFVCELQPRSHCVSLQRDCQPCPRHLCGSAFPAVPSHRRVVYRSLLLKVFLPPSVCHPCPNPDELGGKGFAGESEVRGSESSHPHLHLGCVWRAVSSQAHTRSV